MLIRFTVENFLSFNKRQSLSLAASQGTRHKDHWIENSNHRLLKSSMILGSNSSGKTNLLKALEFSMNLIRNGLNSSFILDKYFKFTKSNYEKPAVFQFDFLIDKSVYSYGFALSYKTQTIISEWLYTGEDNDVCVFETSFENNKFAISTDIKLTLKNKNYFEVFCGDFNNSFPFFLKEIATKSLKTSSLFNVCEEIYNEFDNFQFILNDSYYQELGSFSSITELSAFLESHLTSFDTKIENVIPSIIAFDSIFTNLPKELQNNLKSSNFNKLSVSSNLVFMLNSNYYCLSKTEDNQVLAYQLQFKFKSSDILVNSSDLSNGTLKLIQLILLLLKENNNKIIIIDDFDSNLHHKVTRKLLELYFDISKYNSSQLILTTHDTSLLDLDLFRQDEIWFIDIEDDLSSTLYSLNKFKERYDKSIEKEYLLGKYGGVPNI